MFEKESLLEWIGKKEVREEIIRPWPVQALTATLNGDTSVEPNVVPPGWHWLYFLDAKPLKELGPDGHIKKGTFLPPIPLPRRMWAGGRLTFYRPLKMGDFARKEAEIVSILPKEGRAGKMIFVTVKNTIFVGAEMVAIDEQDLVYLEKSKPSEKIAGKASPTKWIWQRKMHADSVLLFRFSALTFNSHRIHYDLPYAKNEEHYKDLVVHGPLQALLLLDLCRSNAASSVCEFSYRGVSPLYCGDSFTINAENSENSGSLNLWTADSDGNYCMSATAVLSKG